MGDIVNNDISNGDNISVDDLSDTLDHMQVDGEETTTTESNENIELPKTLIVTNVCDIVFQDDNTKFNFESVFRTYDSGVQFQYLRSFRRCRVDFSSSEIASNVRLQLHEVDVCGTKIKCYYAQSPPTPTSSSSQHLEPPPLTKQFLISPPVSPPVGWEPVKESDPVINYDLLSAIATLAPGEAHEVHAGSDDHPKIVVHICEDPVGFINRPAKIIQTARPALT